LVQTVPIVQAVQTVFGKFRLVPRLERFELLERLERYLLTLPLTLDGANQRLIKEVIVMMKLYTAHS
jgi:hypothetical protein